MAIDSNKKKKNHFGDIELGPLLKEDAEFLQAIIKMTNPKVLVELGYFRGASAKAMLDVMDNEAHLFSFDNTKNPTITDPRHTFFALSQEQVGEVGIKDIDFVFLDASHEYQLNKRTFEALIPILAAKAIIAVHDTGTWIGGNVFNADFGYQRDNGEWVHCADELRFVDWVKDNHPEFDQIHFHSTRQVRHGITLIQKYQKLDLDK